jgi:hypothetical protein
MSQMCGVCIDDEMRHQKLQRMIRLDGGTFNNQLGAEALMECRGGWTRRQDKMTEAMMTKMTTIVSSLDIQQPTSEGDKKIQEVERE